MSEGMLFTSAVRIASVSRERARPNHRLQLNDCVSPNMLKMAMRPWAQLEERQVARQPLISTCRTHPTWPEPFSGLSDGR